MLEGGVREYYVNEGIQSLLACRRPGERVVLFGEISEGFGNGGIVGDEWVLIA